ncbi:hypothetical protein KSP39_PZI012553 [Platanthera zijinensis]|uniref:Ubiquitin-like-conjugating enzyme ATG10 n=1 Tax=Platanthera zijinensis TaxID=2320716 RepID=A0AAP0G512_9ASPA
MKKLDLKHVPGSEQVADVLTKALSKALFYQCLSKLDAYDLLCMENQKAFDGTLSADEFYIAANTLCEKWKSANTGLPDWTWMPCKRMPSGASYNDDGYLSLESIYHIKFPKVFRALISNVTGFPAVEAFRWWPLVFIITGFLLLGCRAFPPCILLEVHVPSNVIHAYDFHIAYSHSYRDPVLYFNGHRSDGQPLDLDEIQKDLPEYSRKLLTESKWTFITVEEHPYLHQPWYMLHPCGTSDWMKLLLHGRPDAADYLISWLSVVGQTVGLRVPISLVGHQACSRLGSGRACPRCLGALFLGRVRFLCTSTLVSWFIVGVPVRLLNASSYLQVSFNLGESPL